MNKVFLSGNLTRDPEVKRTTNGKAYSRMGIAINRRYKNPSTGQYQDEVNFFNLVAWEKTAEFCGRYLRKGSRVLVEGRLQTYSYDGKDGVKRSGVDIVVDNIEFADSKRADSQRGGNDNYGGGYQGGNDDLGVPVPDDSVPFMDDNTPQQQVNDDNVPF